MKSQKTPVAVFTYNRPIHTARLLRSLAGCYRLEDCDIHIFCDASTNEEQSHSVAASRAVVKEWAAENGARVIDREHGLGCAHSIVSGVSELLGKSGRVIVLEDDLEVNPGFLDFLLRALDKYECDSRVAQVSASMFAVNNKKGSRDAFFLPFTSPYGWATWQRAWKSFDWNAPGWEHVQSDRAMCNKFDQDGSFEHSDILRSTLSKKIDAWDILWEWSIFREKKLALFPRKSLVRVGGFDGSGTNCGTGLPDSFKTHSAQFQWGELPTPFVWPKTTAIDESALLRIKTLLKRERDPNPSLIRRVQRKLHRHLGRTPPVQEPI